MSEVSGDREELTCVQGQGRQPGGDTLCPRSGAVAERSYSVSEVRNGGGKEIPLSRVRETQVRW